MENGFNVCFFMIGGIEDKDYYKELTECIKERNYEKHFIFTDFVSNPCDYIKNLDIVLHTSKNEPFGRSIVESMYMRKPVIAFSGGPSEILQNEKTGFIINNNNLERASEIAIDLIKNKLLRKNIGENAYIYAIENFNFLDYTEKLKNIIYC